VVAAWSAPAHRRRLALLGLAGRVVAIVAFAMIASRTELAGTHGWSYLLIAAVAVEVGGWIALARRPHGRGLPIVTGAATAALIAGAVVREAPRLALLEPVREQAAGAGGLPVFLATLLIGGLAIGWIVRTIRQPS